MRNLTFLLLIIVLFGCTEHRKNQIKISFCHKTFTNHNLKKNFGYYTHSCYFALNEQFQQYIYFNNNETLILNDSLPMVIQNNAAGTSQSFALNAIGRSVYRLEMNGILSVLKNNQFHPIENLNMLAALKSESLMVGTYYQSQNYCHVYKDLLIFPLIHKVDLMKPYPMFGTYDLKTKKVKVLNIKTPKPFLEYRYGSNNIFSSFLKGDTLFIHYPFSPEITLFSLSKNRTLAKTSPFYNQYKDEIKELNQDSNYELFRYNIESPSFGSLYFNPYKKHYYRFYRLRLDRMNKDEEYTIDEDKKNTVLIYDSQFNYLGQIFLPKKYYLLNELTPTKKGFMLNTNFKVTKNKLIFDEIHY